MSNKSIFPTKNKLVISGDECARTVTSHAVSSELVTGQTTTIFHTRPYVCSVRMGRFNFALNFIVFPFVVLDGWLANSVYLPVR